MVCLRYQMNIWWHFVSSFRALQGRLHAGYGEALWNWMGSVKYFAYKTSANFHRMCCRLLHDAWTCSQCCLLFIFVVCTFAYPLVCALLSRLGFRGRQRHPNKRRQIFPVSATTPHLEVLRWIFSHPLGQDTQLGPFQKLHTRLSSSRCNQLWRFGKLCHRGDWVFKPFSRNYSALDEFRYPI